MKRPTIRRPAKGKTCGDDDTDPGVVQRIDDVHDVTVTGMHPFGHQLDGDHLGEVDGLQLEWVPDMLRLAIPVSSH